MIKSEMRTVRLGDLLTEEQAEKVYALISSKDAAGLKSYLRSIKDDLDFKGVVPDYLYYVLVERFGM